MKFCQGYQNRQLDRVRPDYSLTMHNTSSPNILVLGGSGFVGRHVCEHLSRLGWRVTVPTRRLPARSVQMLPGVSVVSANVHEPRELNALVRGHDAVVNLVAILHGNEAAFEQVHVTLPTLLAKACKAAGVRRVVHISALGADVHGPSMYQRSKARGELALMSAAQSSDLGLTILRPSVIFGTDDRFINLFAKLQSLFPIMPLAGSHTRFQPVWVHDVAQAVVRCLQDARTVGQGYEACGPEVLTLSELVQFAGQWVGHPRPVLPLPHAIGWLQALLMEIAPGPTLMSRDNLASMQVDNIASGRLDGLAALGMTQPRALRAVFAPMPTHASKT